MSKETDTLKGAINGGFKINYIKNFWYPSKVEGRKDRIRSILKRIK